MPYSVVLCVVALMLAGLTGIERADELSGASDRFARQVVWIAMSLGAMLAVTVVPYRTLRPASYGLFLVTIGLLVAVYFMPARNGARRWIPLGIAQFQPSELAKLTFIMALAHYLMYRRNYRRLTGLVAPFVLTLIPVTLILREPDLGTSMLFLPVLFAMLFAAGARRRHLIAVSLLGLATTPALWMVMNAEQKSRVVTLFTQQDRGGQTGRDNYHLNQSKQVLALGGVWGSAIQGMATDDLSAYRLPESRTDFVFCLIGERWGVVGTVSVLIVFLILLARGLRIAAVTSEPFGRLLVVGVIAQLGAQAVINTGMTVGLMPITGMTLPLVSYGGSSMLSTCLALGLVLNVAIRPGYEVAPQPFRFRD